MTSSCFLFSLGILPTALGTHSTSATMWIAVVVTGISALVAGVLTGVLVYYCIRKHQSQSCKPESSSNQHSQGGPVYEEVSATCAGEMIELKENVAYGHMQH